ncbi:MAG: HEAT repeat domain-containing protein [Fuerstiella sp.]
MRFACSISIICIAAFAAAPDADGKLKSTNVPRYDVAVAKGVAFMQGNASKITERTSTLAAYALLKAGVKATDPVVAEGIKVANERAEAGSYSGYDHIYLAGVDAMLLADSGDHEAYFVGIQNIARYVESVQRSDGSWSDGPQGTGDISMSQYGVLALWAAKRVGCDVSPDSFDRAAAYFLGGRNGDRGWGYRPGTTKGLGGGNSTHNMSLAGAGSVAVCRTMLHGPKGYRSKSATEDPKKFGVLTKAKTEDPNVGRNGSVYPNYNARNSAGNLDSAVDGGISWNNSRPYIASVHKLYFYYCLERASALADLKEGWYTSYGDVLLKLQTDDGSFKTNAGDIVGTSFAILYFVRSTKQILDKQYSGGVMMGGRDASTLFGDKKKKKDIGPLDELLAAMENADLDSLDVNADDLIEKIQFGSKEDLIGQVDLLKRLLQHPDATNRQAAFFALGRTGDFSLIPLILKGLRDPNVDVNSEALQALRYISRKPRGFGLKANPLDGPATSSEAQKVVRANAWRTKAYRAWHGWYASVRPFKELDGLDALELLSTGGGQR